MQIEIPNENRECQVEMLEQNGSLYKFTIDGRVIELDILMVENGAYSVIHEGKSFNFETIISDNPKKYIINTLYTSHEVDLVDAASKYQRSRMGADESTADSKIMAPMPGKIVKVFVEPGQAVEQGETLVIVSAMKMESEYKAGKDGIIKEVLVKDGDTVDGGQVMVILD